MKTRTIAADVISRGKCRVNSAKVTKPAHTVAAGDVLTLNYAGRTHVVRLLACADRRGSPAEAQCLYETIAAEDAVSSQS